MHMPDLERGAMICSNTQTKAVARKTSMWATSLSSRWNQLVHSPTQTQHRLEPFMVVCECAAWIQTAEDTKLDTWDSWEMEECTWVSIYHCRALSETRKQAASVQQIYLFNPFFMHGLMLYGLMVCDSKCSFILSKILILPMFFGYILLPLHLSVICCRSVYVDKHMGGRSTGTHTGSSSSQRNVRLSKQSVAHTFQACQQRLIGRPDRGDVYTQTCINKDRDSHKQTTCMDLPECFFFWLCALSLVFLPVRMTRWSSVDCLWRSGVTVPPHRARASSRLPGPQLLQLCLCY